MNMRVSGWGGFLLLLILSSSHGVFAEVTLPAVLNNNMVVQQGVKVPIWGWAEPGEQITVSFGGQSKSTKTEANQTEQSMIISGKNTIKLKNILTGEEWLCSGQSNMVWCLGATITKRNLPELTSLQFSCFNQMK